MELTSAVWRMTTPCLWILLLMHLYEAVANEDLHLRAAAAGGGELLGVWLRHVHNGNFSLSALIVLECA